MGSGASGSEANSEAPTEVLCEGTAASSSPGTPTRGGSEELSDFAPPPDLERYIMVEVIGRGGLGLVYSAWDPQLERKVAVKLIRSKVRRDRVRAVERFLQEARSMAQLSHPNVATIYDVGTYDDANVETTAFLVMELLEGKTLSRWLRAEPSVASIVEVFTAAGRGLAAAHAEGLVHRDFKPDNVMVCSDGSVKVLDFGLALVSAHTAQSAERLSDDSLDIPLSTERLTETGLVMGTPRYMAPEQHAARAVGPQTDQFSFCVAMLRALRGREVFRGTTLRELVAAKRRGQLEEAPPEDPTPRRIEAALVRGLSPEPNHRWPSMDALLGVLSASGGRKRPWILAGVAAIALAGGTAWALAPRGPSECADGAERLAATWTSSATGGIEDALTAAESRAAPLAITALKAWHVDEIDGWAAVHRATCDARAEGVLDDPAFDRRMQCLRGAAAAREQLLPILAEPTAKTVKRLPEQLAAMPSVALCEDDDRLAKASMLPRDPESRERVATLRENLQRARTLSESAKGDEAREIIEAAVQEAEALGFEPLVAEVGVALGLLEVDAGNFEEAVEIFDKAAVAAESSGQDFAATEAAAALTFVLAQRLTRPKDAKLWLGRAKASLERAGRPAYLDLRVALGEMSLHYVDQDYAGAAEVLRGVLDTFEPKTEQDRLQTTVLLGNLAICEQMLGRYDAAIDRGNEALALRKEVLGAEHPAVARLQLNVANSLSKAGRYDEAMARYELAIASGEANAGKDSFEVANYYVGRGVVLKKQGRYDAARKDYEHALEVFRKSVGEDAPVVAMTLGNLGNVEKRVGNYDRALALHEEALALREKRLGAEHVDVAASLDDIGSLMRKRGQLEQGVAKHRQALEIRTKVLGDKHPELIASYLLLGNASLEDEKAAEAKAFFEQGLELERAAGTQDTNGALLHYGLGRVALVQEEFELARSELLRTIELLEKARAAIERFGDVRFDLAKAHFGVGDTSLARDALSQARVELRSGGVASQEQLEALEAWAETLR